MNKASIRIQLVMMFAALCALSGCAPTPPATFYQLEEPASTQLSGLARGIAVGVERIDVAPYLDRPQIVIRRAGHQLQLSEFHRWVEPLDESIARVIIVNLSNMLSSTRVYRTPRRTKIIDLEFRVEIDIARFDGTLGGDAVLVGRWTLYGQEGAALSTRVSIIREASDGEGFDRLIAAQNRTLQQLIHEIADAIEANR